MRRIKLVLGVLALLSLLLMTTAAPAVADHRDRDCFPFCDHNDRHDHDNDDEDVDVDVEGPFLIGDEICVFVVTEEEDNGDEDVDVDEECVDWT
jgi:hypothetical protein